MRLLSFLLIFVCVIAARAESEDHDYEKEFAELNLGKIDDDLISALELEQIADVAPVASYIPDSGVYDNPATDITPTLTLPATPSCTIRGQTIFEIRKMRTDARQIAMAISYEIQTMEKRKAYIEQMTNYLNDRIRELNKVKRDLAAEVKWVQVSNQRIAELAQKEKLIKLQDVMSCIRAEQERLNGEKDSKTFSVNSLAAQAAQLQSSIQGIRGNIQRISATPFPTAAGYPGPAPGAVPAPAGQDMGPPPPPQ